MRRRSSRSPAPTARRRRRRWPRMLIERAGQRVAMAGNIGPTMLQTLADALDSSRRGCRRADAAGRRVWRAFEVDGGSTRWSSERRRTEPLLNVRRRATASTCRPPPPARCSSTCPRSGCSSSRASSSTASRASSRRRDGAEHHAGPPRLARLDGGLRAAKARVFGERAVMVINRDDPRSRADPGAARRQGRTRKPVERDGRPLRPRRAAAPRRLRPGRSRTAWPGWCARCEVDETREARPRPSAAVDRPRSCTSSA